MPLALGKLFRVMRGGEISLAINEKRRDVAVPPWSHEFVFNLDDRVSSARLSCHRLRGGRTRLSIQRFAGILQPACTGKLVLNVELEQLHALHVALDILGDFDDRLEERIYIRRKRIQVEQLLVVGNLGVTQQ